ncbi:hypothetical protein PO909_026940 [Leuciscus waleckii]
MSIPIKNCDNFKPPTVATQVDLISCADSRPSLIDARWLFRFIKNPCISLAHQEFLRLAKKKKKKRLSDELLNQYCTKCLLDTGQFSQSFSVPLFAYILISPVQFWPMSATQEVDGKMTGQILSANSSVPLPCHSSISQKKLVMRGARSLGTFRKGSCQEG